MKPQVSLAGPHLSSIICCPVAGFATLRATPEQIAALRQNPVPASSQPSLLKYADEQTIAGLGAVVQAIQRHGLAESDFSEWGVVAATSFLGRSALAATLQRMAVEGAWGVSPHFIPQHSLHATSGTISQALKIHGPNFGIETSACGIAEALTVAATMLATGDLPGLWLVLTQYEPEFIPVDPKSEAVNGIAQSVCNALALALLPDTSLSLEIMLRVCPQGKSGNMHGTAWTSWTPLENVSTLAAALERGLPARHWRLGLHGWVEVTPMDLGPENTL